MNQRELLVVQSDNAEASDNRQTPIEIAMEIDEDGFTTVKKLYEWLGLDEGNYSRWVKSNILENPYAEEGVDYASLPCMEPVNDYRISVSFAKKLSRAQRSYKGELARVYFLMCEEQQLEVAEQRDLTRIERIKNEAAKQALTDVILECGWC